jgi:hypothetical protein
MLNQPITPPTSNPAVLAIIGAGQIGSRHLQALANLDRTATVFIIDPSSESLATAETRFKQVAKRDHVSLKASQKLTDLPAAIDVAIIATNSNVRLELLKGLLAHSRVSHVILEKVLFQSQEECDLAAQLLKGAASTAWVNCPKRLSPLYSDVRKELDGEGLVNIYVSGSNWGLGCNSIHFLDLAQFITGSTESPLIADLELDQGSPAKRKGFVEFTGSLNGSLGKNVRFTLRSFPTGDAPPMIQIDSARLRYLIVEEDGILRGWRSSGAEGWVWQPVTSPSLYQSQLTHLLVQALLDNGQCALPRFEESVILHYPLLKALNHHLFGDAADAKTKCPIT